VLPETKYAKSGDIHIAYQVVGDGPVDLVFIPGWFSHQDLQWEDPAKARFLRRLAAFARLILFDKRGVGLSDRVPPDQLPILEERIDDVRAVLDAVGSERAALFGVSEGGAMCALFAATYPDRTAALVLYSTRAVSAACSRRRSFRSGSMRSRATGPTRSRWSCPHPHSPATRTTGAAG
jgi:pimeloyl-ACP methyl ester carboxylesterase